MHKPTPVASSKTAIIKNYLQPLVVDIEHTPLADIDYKIENPIIEFNLLELHNWSYEKSLDNVEEVQIWESHLPKYVVPVTHSCPKVIILCHHYYMPEQRTIVNANKEVLFTITVESINQMLQLKPNPQAVPLSIEALTKLYIGLEFPRRFQIFQIFMPLHVEIPQINPPYSTSKFPEGSRHVISMLSFILAYFTNEHTDESILGFLSTFTPGQPPYVIFDYA